jgi:hypothetical protein
MGESIHTIKKSTEALLVAGIETGVKVNVEKSKYMFIPHEQKTVKLT